MVDEWGIEAEYVDAEENPASSDPESIATLREIIGRPPEDLERIAPVFVSPWRALPDDARDGEVELEDGGTASPDDELPTGYHTLRAPDGSSRRLIVSPGACRAPASRLTGWAAQLYASRSRASWGMGDLGDLARITGWASGQGAGFVLVNPLHAAAPTLPQQASPYFPSSREFRSPLYLDVSRVPGVDAKRPEGLDTPVIDRDAVWTAKRAALRAAFDRGTSDDFAAWRRGAGASLESFATWCALAEEHGASWRSWPEGLRRPDGADVRAFADAHPDDVAFHAWLQFLVAAQLADASEAVTVIQDLPIGFDPDGVDAWRWQDVLAEGVSVGAPPDPFNRAGQDWGLPPFVPWRLRAADYEPFIDSIRSTAAAGGGLRIDHVMGLFRLWWVPPGASADKGAYVRYPADDLLDIVALESERAGAIVVGEDLGTVEDGVRETLAERKVLSYRLFWFEDEPPAEYPESAMAAISTHDLPTVAGVWTGSDLDDQEHSGVVADASATEELREHLTDIAGVAEDADAATAVTAAYASLADAPCALVSATLDDAAVASRRPNIPGSSDRDNWCIPLPAPLEDVLASPQAAAIAEALAR